MGGEASYDCQCRPGLKASAVNKTLGYAPRSDVDECNTDDPDFVNLCGPNAECVNYDPQWDNTTDTQGVLYRCQCKDGYITDEEASSIPPFSYYSPHAEQYAFKCIDRDECGDEIKFGVEYALQYCQYDRL